MRATLLLCGLSASLGVAAALGWYGLRGGEAVAVAEAASARTPEGAPIQPVQYGTPRAATTRGSAVTSAPQTVPMVPDDLTPEERVNVAVYQSCNRSVANISTKTVQIDRMFLLAVPSEGAGSGIVIDRLGHILTNFHVVEGARQVKVTLFDGKEYEVKQVVGVDPQTDTAVLKIEAPKESLYPVTFGNSSGLLVGQRVFAIGNPFGFERTLSTGIISNLNQSLPAHHTNRTIKSIIQIDAAINPGNSGGPLLDSHARMIGMNTAIASKTGESAGVGFAIPVNTIVRIVPQLIQNGRVRRPDSGIVRVYQTDRGLTIYALTPNGAAQKAGLRGPAVVRKGPFVGHDLNTADTIVGVDGQPVHTGDDFLAAIEAKQPGDTVAINVIREGKEVAIPLRLESGD
jgi:S1-C subfamily serine protease